MDYELTRDEFEEKLVETLQGHGVAVCKGYTDDFSLIKEEAEKIIENTEEADYLFGKVARIGSIEENRVHNPALATFFSQPWMFQKFYEHTGAYVRFTEIFVQNDYRNDKGVSRNGILHFDRIPTFKFMLYLTDVEKEDGPLSVIPGTHLDGSYLRTKATEGPNIQYADIKNWPLVDYPELGYSEDDIVPICGPAGTLIAFDTDVFHRGGLVGDNRSRLMVRSHLRGFNG